jgi:methyl-accepting chemotaxis protein
MRRLGLTGRIWLSIGVLLAGYMLATTVGQVQAIRAEAGLVTTSEALFPAALRGQEAAARFERMTRGYADALMLEDTGALDRADQEGREVAALLAKAASYPGLGADEAAGLQRLAASVTSLVTSARAAYTPMIGAGGTFTDAMQRNSRAVAATTEQLKQAIDKMREQLAAGLRDELATQVRGSATQRWVNIIVFLVSLAAAACVVYFAIRRGVIGVLHQSIATLRDGTGRIVTSAGHVGALSQQLSQGATEQAASLEETSAAMEEMASMTRKNAENSAQAAAFMAEADRMVKSANAALDQLVASMAGIQASSDKVAKIIKTIDEIAFQTNILSLNAAVEAARAGDAGMGFAVVADEVRRLAQQSAQAAKDTAALIEEARGKAQDGNAKVQAVGTAIAAVTGSSARVRGLVDEISTASREQAQGISQVTLAISQMEQVTQTTAATAEEGAAASEELNTEATVSRQFVDELERMMGGAAAAPAAPERPGRAAAAPARASNLVRMSATRQAAPVVDDGMSLPGTGTFGQF